MGKSLQYQSWVTANQERIIALKQQVIIRTYWIEMALNERDSNLKHRFRHPDLPFVQASTIRLEFSDGNVGVFHNYQNDDNFGLMFELSNKPLKWPVYPKFTETGDLSIYREVTDTNFPTGVINSTSSKLDNEGDITEIFLEISGKQILLKAGEVYEDGRREIIIHEQDESILTFLNPDDISKIQFGEHMTIDLNDHE